MRAPLSVLPLAALLCAAALVAAAPHPAKSEGVIAVAAGGSHTCALTAAGGVKCWGDNTVNQLGIGTAGGRSTVPLDVVDLDAGVVAIDASDHTCAITSGGGLKCWGNNSLGQLGDGTTTDRATPVDVLGLQSGVTDVSTGAFHTCVVMATGSVKCWGRNVLGQLGVPIAQTTERCFLAIEEEPCSTTPLDVRGLDGTVTEVGAGGNHTCALIVTGGIKCWGSNVSSELGAATSEQCIQTGFPNPCSTSPLNVAGLGDPARGLTSGGFHTCALGMNGTVKCWGDNFDGQLGDNWACGVLQCLAPVDVVGLDAGVAAVAAGGFHTCAQLTTGAVKCWGSRQYCQLGGGIPPTPDSVCPLAALPFSVPVPVDVCGQPACSTHLAATAAVSAGHIHTCAVPTRGGVKCWGANGSGQVGIGRCCLPVSAPLDVVGLGPKPEPSATPTATLGATVVPTPSQTPDGASLPIRLPSAGEGASRPVDAARPPTVARRGTTRRSVRRS
jgi:alpha-tubulin suppressor-like RCC1 family protein